MAKARYDHTATLLPDGEVLVTGGIGIDNPQAPCVGTAELFDPATGHWCSTGSMTTPRYLQGAALLQGGQVLVAGGAVCWGFAGGGSPGTSAELYDPSNGAWKATGRMNFSHMSPLTLLKDGRALLTDETSEQLAVFDARLYIRVRRIDEPA